MEVSFRSVILILGSIFVASAQSGNNTTSNQTLNSTQPNDTVISPPWLNSSLEELNKFMSDRYNYYLTPKGNKIWSCALDLAWNQMKRTYLSGNNATFQNTNQLQQKITDNYNTEMFNKDQITDTSYYVGSGYGQQAQNQINLQVKEKFPTKMFPPLSYQLKDQDFIVYTYFQKVFQFQTPFAKSTYFKFKGVQVEGFTSLTSKHRKQLYYKYYNSQTDFLMGIKTANKNQEILLLKTNKTQFQNIKIDKITHWIEMYSALPNKKLKSIDSFAMPVLTFDYTRTFKEMDGLKFLNPEVLTTKISVMQERLQMKLDRFGVRVYNDGVLYIMPTSMYVEAKYFILNKDFWVIMKQKNKKPYLIINVRAVSEKWSSTGQ